MALIFGAYEFFIVPLLNHLLHYDMVSKKLNGF